MQFVEREVRFLMSAKAVDVSQANDSITITEAHLLSDKVGVRIRKTSRLGEDTYELTLKFREDGYSLEHVIGLSAEQGENLLQESQAHRLPTVSKTRYMFGTSRPYWEVDLYHERLDFLAIAEFEYDNAQQSSQIFRKPEWFLGANWRHPEMDVTNDWKFLQKILATDPIEFEKFRETLCARLKRIESEGSGKQ